MRNHIESDSLHLERLLPLYLEALERRRLALATRDVRARGLEKFRRFLAQRSRGAVNRLSSRDVEEFQVWLCHQRVSRGARKGLPLAPETVQAWMAGVSGFCRWLVDTDVLLWNPCQDIRRPRLPRSLPRVLTVPQVERLLRGTGVPCSVEQRDRAIVELLYAAGLRVGELRRLDVTDLDLMGAQVFIQSSKNGESRCVPIGEPAVQALTQYLHDTREDTVADLPPGIFPAVFLGRLTARLSTTMIELIIRERARAVGLPGRVTPHTLRHSAAVHLLQGGADIRFIQAFLGHRFVETTVHYTRLYLEDLKKTLKRCHPREQFPGDKP